MRDYALHGLDQILNIDEGLTHFIHVRIVGATASVPKCDRNREPAMLPETMKQSLS